jgi:hypothetical protein
MTNQLEIVLNQSTGEKKHKIIDDISKKITKIERLNKELENLKTKITSLKIKVDSQAEETKLSFFKAKENYILLLVKKHELKGLAVWQKGILAELINEEFEILTDMDYESELLNQTLHKFIKQQGANLSPYEKQMKEEVFAEFFKSLNIDIDPNDIDNIDDPAFKKKMQEKIFEQQAKQQQEEKEFQQEKRNKNTDIDFQKVYKKLAKLAHPDLCKSADEKEIKEQQMKLLTAAWENRDYYEILMLWIAIDPENTIGLEINEKNQKNIIAQLNTKISELEHKDYILKRKDPETAFYYQNFNAPSEKATQTKINKYIQSLEITASETNEIATLFQKTANLKSHIKEIYERQMEEEYDDFESFLGMNFDANMFDD